MDLSSHKVSLSSTFLEMRYAFQNLPLPIWRLCKAQFFAWMAWFPFLFYATLYVGEVALSTSPGATENSTSPSAKDIFDAATKQGSYAFFLFSIVSAFSSWFLPFVSTDRTRISLRGVYVTGLVWFTLLMFATVFVTSAQTATAVVSLAGISWAVMMWVPFAYIGIHLNSPNIDQINGDDYIPLPTVPNESGDTIEDTNEVLVHSKRTDAGLILGIHNIFVVLPQFVVLLVSAILFKGMDMLKSYSQGQWAFTSETGLILRVGALGSLIAVYFGRYL